MRIADSEPQRPACANHTKAFGRRRIDFPHFAFTLIELLVVVAIIALLISILLPALTRAREQGRAVVCLSNVKQITQAFFIYATDDKVIPGGYWQGPINVDWCGKNNYEYINNPGRYKHPLQASVLRRYLAEIDRILECKTGQRQANTIFDYTMLIRLAGARTDLPWYMTYPKDPTRAAQTETRFQAIPFLFEEDERFYNHDYDDGSFANLDQITDRHNKGANIGYLDGSAARFVGAKGGNADREEPQDLTTQHLKLYAKKQSFPVWSSNSGEFGWVNNPK